MTTNSAVALPPGLHACVNDFLAQANEMQKNYKYDAISASVKPGEPASE